MLTAKQEAFVQGVVLGGMNYTEAYRSAYNAERMSDKTVNEKASILANDGKIRARMQELRESLVTPKIMSAQQRLEWLSKLIQSEGESTTDKLRAADIMNKMQGEYVQKVEAEVNSKVNINIELSDD